MSTIASTNRKHLLSGVLLALDEEVKVEVEAKIEALTWTYKNKPLENKDAVGGSIVDMLRSPVTRIRLILMVAINFFCAVVYYGLSMNVVLNAVAEIPAYRLTAILSEKFGRKPLAIGTMCFSGIFGMAVTYNLLFIYTAELFSTMVRNQVR
ncbi:Organic cation/carnitine transporter [Arachis hypogaea]|nr:Organic cation/carnitine transporter [Arachis hypogaea]